MKNSEENREEKRKKEVKRNSQDHETAVRVQKKKIRSEMKKDKRFEGEGGSAVMAEGARLSSGGIQAGGF